MVTARWRSVDHPNSSRKPWFSRGMGRAQALAMRDVKPWVLGVLWACLPAQAAYAESAPPPDSGINFCQNDGWCACGQRCVNGMCETRNDASVTLGQACSDDSVCDTRCTGLQCISGTCQPRDASTPSDLGTTDTGAQPALDVPTQPTLDVPVDRPTQPPTDTGTSPPSDTGPAPVDAGTVADTGGVEVPPEDGGCSASPGSARRGGWAAVVGLVALAFGLRRRRRD